MQCQLCALFGDTRFNFAGLPMKSLRKHSKIHQLQINRVSEVDRKTRSWEERILNRCFPNCNAGADTKIRSVETEIAGRRRREFLNERDGNSSGSKKKRRIRDDFETAKEIASTTEKSDTIRPQSTPQEHTIKPGNCHRYGISALRNHCSQLKTKFGQKGKITCRGCSTTLVVAGSISSAVDHVTRCHFGRKLYACRLCSKRYTAYYAMASHVRCVHRQPLKDAFVDNSEEHKNEIIELLTECYGGTMKTGDGNCQVEKPSESLKGGTVSTLATSEQHAMKAGEIRGRGVMDLRSHCHELKRNFSQKGKMICRICSTEVLIRSNIISALDHVTRCHFGRKCYACPLCPMRFRAYLKLADHSRKCHHKSAAVAGIDVSEEYYNEIMELLTKCYGEAAKEEDVANATNTGSITVAIRSCFYAYGMNKNVGRNRNLTCRVCEKEEIRPKTLEVVSHIGRFHFREILFTCRLCSKGFCSYGALASHISHIHRQGASNNYLVHAEQYEKEIMKWIITCFGEAEKTGKELERDSAPASKMQCQLCASFGDARFKFDGLPMESLRKHSKIHQLQIDRVSKEDTKTRSWEQRIFDRCFPSVDAAVSAKSSNAENEIAGRRGRGFLNEQDGNNGGSKKKRRIRDNLEETRQTTASAAEKRGAIRPQSTPKQKANGASGAASTLPACEQHAMESGGIRGLTLATLRSHFCELKKFCQNRKTICRLCSTELARSGSATNAVDHVTRRHFSQSLYACRFCSKRYSAYGTLAKHSRTCHQKSVTAACIDLSEEYKNEIMELMTKCYGAVGQKGDNTKKVGNNADRITIAIRLCFRKLHGNFGCNGKLICRVCPKLTVRTRTLEVVSHIARDHLGKPLFTCRLCSKGFYTYDAMAHHFRITHKVSSSGNYFVHTSRYEKDIIEWMRTCFGEAKKAGDDMESDQKES